MYVAKKKKQISLKDFPYGNEYFPFMSEEQKKSIPEDMDHGEERT